jgi:hypothetical protein
MAQLEVPFAVRRLSSPFVFNMYNQLIQTLQVDTLRIQRSVDNFILHGIYDVDCRWSEPFVGEYRQLSNLARDHSCFMGLSMSFLACVH